MEKHTHRKSITLAMMVAIFMVSIDTTIVTTAMPNIVNQLSGLKLISWVFAIYLLTTSITTPIYGKLADLFGRKPIFLFGVSFFVIGSMVSGAAQSMTQLILFRGLQGLGGGAVLPLTFTIIGDLYPGEARARIQGVFSSVWGITGLLGPLLGGVIVDHISWRWIFYINLPIGIIAILLVSSFLHETRSEKKSKSIDYWGAAFFTISMGALLLALICGGETFPWGSPEIVTLFAVALGFFLVFLKVESKAEEPMLPLYLFKVRVIAVADIVGFLISFVQIGVSVYMPIWIQTLLGHSATSSGLTLMPMSIAWPVASALAGRYMYRLGIKNVDIFGAVLVAAGTLFLLFIPVDSPYWLFVLVMIVIGFGMGSATMPLTVLIQLAVGWNLRGSATASQTFARSLGQTVGVAIYGTLFNNALNHQIAGSWQGEDISSALTTGAGSVPAGVLEQLRNGMAHSLHTVFLLVFVLSLVTLFFSHLLPSQRQVLELQKLD
jgi:EmrB/QacA subfamily drug resistance transporter